MEKARNLLSFNNIEAREFFLEGKSYFNADMPDYFQLDKFIEDIAKVVGVRELHDLKTALPPKDCEFANYPLFTNKDGQYAWRKLQLINPLLYVAFINVITKQNNWKAIKKRFAFFAKNSKIKCLSIPVKSDSSKKTNAASQILSWWENVEQKSIEMSLEYNYIFVTDIFHCYDSIYTHSLAWAIHDKDTAKKGREDKKLLGNIIDVHLQAMSYGQTNGIPQGSVLMDFIAEIVLGYADSLLGDKLAKLGIEKYQILRYRDDYKIFVNHKEEGDAIIKALTEILSDLGLRLNKQKTYCDENIPDAAVKADKIFWINNGTRKSRMNSLQEELVIISNLAKNHPNSGSLCKALNSFLESLTAKKKILHPKALIAIVMHIAYKNPRVYPMATAIVSRLLRKLSTDEKKKIIALIKAKFENIPNNAYLELWLQRLSVRIDSTVIFQEKLCRVVSKQTVSLWDNSWATSKFANAINSKNLINFTELKKISPIIKKKEVNVFVYY
jgi:hypothetical protein